MERASSIGRSRTDASVHLPQGASVPSGPGTPRAPNLVTPAVRKSILQRMLLFRQASLDRIAQLADCPAEDLKRYRQELIQSGVPEELIQRGANFPLTRELPQGALLYLLVRAARPGRVIETGVRPGYSTTWLLAALEANGVGNLTSLGPGPVAGRAAGVPSGSVGQLVAPSLRSRWTLVLGNSEERLEEILASGPPVDLFFYDNGTDLGRAQFELRKAWAALGPRGLLLAHHVDANPAWSEFCQWQGLAPQVLDSGPPPLGALAVHLTQRGERSR